MKFCTRADGVMIVVLYNTLFVAINEGGKYVKHFAYLSCKLSFTPLCFSCNNLLNKFVNKLSFFVT